MPGQNGRIATLWRDRLALRLGPRTAKGLRPISPSRRSIIESPTRLTHREPGRANARFFPEEQAATQGAQSGVMPRDCANPCPLTRHELKSHCGRARRRCYSLATAGRILRCRYWRACSPCGPVGWCSGAKSDMDAENCCSSTGAMTISDFAARPAEIDPGDRIRRSSSERQRSDRIETASSPAKG